MDARGAVSLSLLPFPNALPLFPHTPLCILPPPRDTREAAPLATLPLCSPPLGTPVKLRHWQLRDLISFGRDDGELFAVHGTGIALYRLPGSAAAGHDKEGYYCAPEPSTSLPSSSAAARRLPQLPSAPNRTASAAAAGSSLLAPQRCTAMDVGFHASCMTYSDGFLAAGGQSGEVRAGRECGAGGGGILAAEGPSGEVGLEPERWAGGVGASRTLYGGRDGILLICFRVTVVNCGSQRNFPLTPSLPRLLK